MANAVKRIGVLTSGGDAPGMNAAIRSVVRACTYMGIECVGIRRGYNGLINGDFMVLKNGNVAHIINRGGTMLYTARSDEFRTLEGQKKAAATCKLLGLDGIVSIGGDGSFRGLVELAKQGISVVGVPATIDRGRRSAHEWRCGCPFWRHSARQYRCRGHRPPARHDAVA